MADSDDSPAKPPAAGFGFATLPLPPSPSPSPPSPSPTPLAATADESTTGTAHQSASASPDSASSTRQASAEMDELGKGESQGELETPPSLDATAESDVSAAGGARDGQSEAEVQATEDEEPEGRMAPVASLEQRNEGPTTEEAAGARSVEQQDVEQQNGDQASPLAAGPLAAMSEPRQAVEAHVIAVGSDAAVAASAPDELADAELSPSVADPGSEAELMDFPAFPDDYDEPVDDEPADEEPMYDEDVEVPVDEEPMDGEDVYSEPGESPSASPLPSPSREEFATSTSEQPVDAEDSAADAGEQLVDVRDTAAGASELPVDVEAACNGVPPLDIAMQSPESLRLDASSPFSTSVNGPGCSTTEDMPESPTSNLESPSQEDECDQPNSPNQDTEQADSPRAELETPGPDSSASSPGLKASSPTQSDGPPLSLEATSSPAADLGSPQSVDNEPSASPPSKIVAPRSKKPAVTNPPPAPTAAKKHTKAVGAKPTASSRLPMTKTPAAVKPAPKRFNATKTSKAGAVGTPVKAENPKKAAPAKTATAKKSAPKAVVYNVAPAPRAKRAAASSARPNQGTASAPTDLKTADGSGSTEIAGSDQDGAQVHPKRVSKAKSQAASNRLYDDAKAAKLRKEARSAEVDEACTFIPKVGSTTTKRPSLGETDRFVALHEEAKQLQAKKQELQRKHEEETCTFRPTITSKAKKLARESARPRYENLYMQAREMKQKREEKALAKKKEDESECSFRPKIKPSKSPVQSKPLYDAERDKQKQLQLEQKRKEAELSECTFKPKVLSKKPATKPEAGGAEGDDGKIYDRLYRAGKVQAERIERMRKEREDEEKAKAPFQPKLVTSSAGHKAKETDPAQVKEPFHKRLYKKDHVQKLSADREQQKLEDERRFSYKPKISEMPEEIKAKTKEYTSPDKPVFERLYEEKDKLKEKLQAGEEMRAQQEMAGCTFRPRVASSVASSGGSNPTSPVWERLSICHKSQTMEEREKLRQQLELQECTFKPVISASDHVSPYRSPSYLSRRLSSTSESCSPSFERKASVTVPRSSPGERASLAQFQPVSIGNILKSSTLVLTEDKSPASDSNTSSSPASATKSSMQANDNAFAELDSPRRPSPVHKPTEVDGNHDRAVANKQQPVARSLDAEFEEMQEDAAVLS